MTSSSNNNIMNNTKDEHDSVEKPLNDVIPSFSFSGCGFLGVYHVGVAACLREHTDVTNRPEIRFAGASAGALVATTLLCGMKFGEMARILLDTANAVRGKEDVDLRAQLSDMLEFYLPDDAHVRLRRRLYISVTKMDGLESGMVTDFTSKEHLMQCLIATCFVPGFLGWLPPSIPVESFVELGKEFPLVYVNEEMQADEQEKIVFDEDCGYHKEESCCNGHTGSLWDVISDDECLDESMEEEKKPSYMQMLVSLCFKSLSTTSKVVQRIPLASSLVNSILPKGLGGLDGLAQAIVMELLSAKSMAFDGGFSDNIPSFDSNTITVSPFAGEIDICPRDLTGIDISFDLGNTSMQASEDNIFRLSHALNPMEPAMLLQLCEEGYNECLRFLNYKDLLCCKKHLMTRATLSSSVCNIGHAYCKCELCVASDRQVRKSLSCVRCQQTKRKALNSTLPEDVFREFSKCIEAEKLKHASDGDLPWDRVLSLLWWCVQKFYATTISLADYAIKFQEWAVKFYDNIGMLTRYAVLPLGKKRKLVRFIIASLHQNVLSSVSMKVSTS